MDNATLEELSLADDIVAMMNRYPGHSFAFGAILIHNKMQVTYYSRSVYVISDAFDVVHDPVVLSLLSLLFSKSL